MRIYNGIDDVLGFPNEEQAEGIVVAIFQATDGDEMDTDNSFITYSIAAISPIPAAAVRARMCTACSYHVFHMHAVYTGHGPLCSQHFL